MSARNEANHLRADWIFTVTPHSEGKARINRTLRIMEG
jgi:hypothetical protein